MHYGFTRTCVGECVSRYSNVCPSLPEADKCSHNCHQTCGYGEDTVCFYKCVSATCPNMQDECVDCIERCAASKVVVQEVDDRSSDFEMPQLKAHFSESFIAVSVIRYNLYMNFVNSKIFEFKVFLRKNHENHN